MRKGIFLFAIFFLTLLFSCKKDGELSPDFDKSNLSVQFTDAFSIKSTVIKEDSLRTDKFIYNLLGLYNDPIFGPMSSSIYAQVTLTGLNVDFDSPRSTLDSVVLTLDYAGLYGDTTTSMSVNVYELSNDMLSSEYYYSNTYVSYSPTVLGTSTFVPNLSDSVNLDFEGQTRAPHLRIKLDNTFGKSLMNADAGGSNKMVDNTTFLTFMKGLYITTVDSVSNTSLLSGAGSVASFDMNSTMSTLTIYYNDTSSYDFMINTEGIKYSRFAHDYTGTDIEAHLNQSLTRDTTLTYVSSMAGVRTKLEISNIKDLSQNGTIVINKAELVVSVEPGSEASFNDALSKLALTGINANGEAIFLLDEREGQDHFNIKIDETARTYTYNITRHIQGLIYNTTTDYGLYLIAGGSSITASRAVLGTGKNIVSTMKLNITYSKL